ncbi:hypothetical protein BdWA1_000685 [Babesia duncani]|uniref:Uncharacterized protein n=1 Tax=Babesia duncani TaxID=323732 RepID=A0AAD9UQA4_9APIC|nr:hypothetical protein BdWA1_000685 [Babesia duncani]
MCVYYKRAADLLRWQLSGISRHFDEMWFKGNNISKCSGKLSNRLKPMVGGPKAGINHNTLEDVSYIFSKKPFPTTGAHEGINIYATGACIKTALYILQDLYDYIFKLYLESAKRYGVNLDVYCEECKGSKSHEKKHALEPDDCKGCKREFYKHFEIIAKRILNVQITSGTLYAVDDAISSNTVEEPVLDSFGKF